MITWSANASVTSPLADSARSRLGARARSDWRSVDRTVSLSLTARLGARQPLPANQLAFEASLLERVGGLLGVTGANMSTARSLLNLLGDPGRRTVLERLARQPERPGRTLPSVTGMDHPDLYHRVRSLCHAGFVTKNRHHIYSVDAQALVCAGRYIDLLAVAASLTAKGAPR